MSRTALIVIGSVMAASGALAAVDDLTPELSTAFQEKLLGVVKNGSGDAAAEKTTPFEELEVNSYLRFGVGDQMPVGLTDPSVKLVGDGRVTGYVVVDLDVIRKSQGKKSWFDPSAYLTGRIPITTTGSFQAVDGVGHFTMDRLEVKSVPMPKRLAQEIVTYYTKSPELPNGVDFEQPFPMPSKIKRLDVQAGRAIVTQ